MHLAAFCPNAGCLRLTPDVRVDLCAGLRVCGPAFRWLCCWLQGVPLFWRPGGCYLARLILLLAFGSPLASPRLIEVRSP